MSDQWPIQYGESDGDYTAEDTNLPGIVGTGSSQDAAEADLYDQVAQTFEIEET